MAMKRKKKGAAGKKAGKTQKGTDGLLSMDEAIGALKTSRPTFYRWLRSGKIKGMKVGRQWRFYPEDIERFLRGEGPRIDLPSDIVPLLSGLEGRWKSLGHPPDDVKGGSDAERAVNLMIRIAIELKASDVHLSPHITPGGSRKEAVLRYRIDGVLIPQETFDIRLLPSLVDTWKAMASCDLHERGRPQDGRILLDLYEGPVVDIRISFLPTGLGESLTARILHQAAIDRLSLDRITLSEKDQETLRRWADAPWGLIVVTGPSGSGKTSTHYAVVRHVARPERKVITIEDPIEVYFPWTVQIQVNEQGGLGFPTAIRSALRSDPDVVMIGEIRDRVSMNMAQQMALTGHLVLTTLHAESAVKALGRMVRTGGDAYVVGEAAKLIVSQRLVRSLCPACSEPGEPPAEDLAKISSQAAAGGIQLGDLPCAFRRPVGCSSCGQTGFRGRRLIVELLQMSPAIAQALNEGASEDTILRIAVAQGMTTLAADGARLAAQGETTLAEIIRVLALR